MNNETKYAHTALQARQLQEEHELVPNKKFGEKGEPEFYRLYHYSILWRPTGYLDRNDPDNDTCIAYPI